MNPCVDRILCVCVCVDTSGSYTFDTILRKCNLLSAGIVVERPANAYCLYVA